MLKYLTHKLRTHSLNEENVVEKVDGHDSGTESDDEIDNPEIMMATRVDSVSPADTACSMGSPCFLEGADGTDLMYDHHSSEEELEVINNSQKDIFLPYSPSKDLYADQISPLSNPAESPNKLYNSPRIVHLSTSRCNSTSTLPEKRKWSQIEVPNSTCQVVMQIDYDRITSPSLVENDETSRCFANKYILKTEFCTGSNNKKHEFNLSTCEDIRSNQENIENTENQSSDDEVHHFLDSFSTPVQFRTSPPLEALKPNRNTQASGPLTGGQGGPCPAVLAEHTERNAVNEWTCDAPMEVRSMSPPSKLFHCSVSPRRRQSRPSAHTGRSHRHNHRPCLDFDKMQQLKARSVTAWRHNGEHGGELSVFCW